MKAKQHPFQKYLPDHWNEWVRNKALELSNGEWEIFTVHPFVFVVEVKFEDGSVCVFVDAFTHEDKERGELAVFTEHCGYHIFDLDTISRVKQI